MADYSDRILAALDRKGYRPLKAKALARHLSVPSSQYDAFRRSLRELLIRGRVERGKNHTLRKSQPHGMVRGVFRRTGTGLGFVKPLEGESQSQADILIQETHTHDSVTGDEVLVKVLKSPPKGLARRKGIILEVLKRANRQFVGTYQLRDNQGFVRVDGTVFSHSLAVGDPGAKGVRSGDKVVVEIVRYPSAEDAGEGVVTEVLGHAGKPGVDTLAIIRQFELPDHFPPEVLEEARTVAAAFSEEDGDNRTDFSDDLIITIDPADARDFDDAVSVIHDEKRKHWLLRVHIADVGHFAPPGSELDREARKRGTSVYLPQRVLPMFPEVISNGLASLQEGKRRYVKSVEIDFTPQGHVAHTRFYNGVIKVRKRFSYEQVLELLEYPQRGSAHGDSAILELLVRMRDLALILRGRRLARGAIELNMPETELEFDESGRVAGAHTRAHDISHQIVEEFMLAANEAVAQKLTEIGVSYLRRIHPSPDPMKLSAFAEFARGLGYRIGRHLDRFTLQRIMDDSAQKPEAYAMHYALLRSLKQAVYSPEEEGHFALASESYCHFTSPIRRYPDLTVHRLLGQWLRVKKARSNKEELASLGDHCSKMERRADLAERELVKVKLLEFLSKRIGLELTIIITGVADYGFFGQAGQWPIEGRVHISTLTDDYYILDETSHSLIGKRTRRRYRLGDRVLVTVVRVDVHRRQLDFRVVPKKKKGPRGGGGG